MYSLYDLSAIPGAEMPTSGGLKFYNTPESNYPHHQEKRDDPSSPSNQPPCPQIDLELPMFTLTLQWEKKKIYEVVQGLPKLSQG